MGDGTEETLRPHEVLEGMNELGINVVAHIIHEGKHEYNITRKQLNQMMGDITVLKWGRESLGSPKAKRRLKKGALYQIKR